MAIKTKKDLVLLIMSAAVKRVMRTY